jgi:hypothetical protein
MVIYEFDVEDLARTRFAIAPLFELTQSLRSLTEPARSAFRSTPDRAATERSPPDRQVRACP